MNLPVLTSSSTLISGFINLESDRDFLLVNEITN